LTPARSSLAGKLEAVGGDLQSDGQKSEPALLTLIRNGKGISPRCGQEKVIFVQGAGGGGECLLLCFGVDARSLAVRVGVAHWEIGMDGSAVSLEGNRGINIKE